MIYTREKLEVYFMKRFSLIHRNHLHIWECCIRLLEGESVQPIIPKVRKLKKSNLVIYPEIKKKKKKLLGYKYNATSEICNIFHNGLSLKLGKNLIDSTLKIIDPIFIRTITINNIINS